MATRIDPSTIKIKKVIVHDIPRHKRTDDGIKPSYSEQESELADGLKLFFKDKVVQALTSNKAFKVMYDTESTSTVQMVVEGLLTKETKEFVTSSKSIAKQLFDIQDGLNAAGILVIMTGSVKFIQCMHYNEARAR